MNIPGGGNSKGKCPMAEGNEVYGKKLIKTSKAARDHTAKGGSR